MKNNFERILVCIDDAKKDENILRYTRMVALAMGATQIDLLHVATGMLYTDALSAHLESAGVLYIPESKIKEEAQKALDEKQAVFEKTADEYLGGMEGLKYRVKVLLGNPLWDILRFAKDESTDLIVLGRQYGALREKGGEALLARRISRKATCSVLTIPEDFEPRLKSILVPVRNSQCSATALQAAIDLGNSFEASIEALDLFHIYIPTGGYIQPAAVADDPLAIAKSCAESECKALLEKVDVGDARLTMVCRLDEKYEPDVMIDEEVRKISADLVVIGARGRTGAAGVLLGKVTEKLIKHCHVPVLATKKKGECLGILKAMLSLFE